MRKFLLALSISLMLLSGAGLYQRMAHADIQGAPFLPEVDARFDALEQGNHLRQGSYPSGAADGHYVHQFVQATYDFAKQGGAIGAHDLGVSIPKNAIETRSYIYSKTQPTTSASGTLAFYCGSSSSPDLKQPTAAASYPATGAVGDGTQTGAAAAFSVVASKCDVNALIATGALTAGKVTIYVDYVVHQ